MDGTDEAGCPRLCGADQFYCFSDDVCIDQGLVCNGNNTDGCSDGEEEARCGDIRHRMTQCDQGEFTCSDGSCVPAKFVCDGSRDCEDGSDEVGANCTGQCADKERPCGGPGAQCVADHLWCDGDTDCDDGSDEEPTSEKPAPLDVFAGKLREVLLNPHGAALKLAELKAGGLFRCTSVDPYDERVVSEPTRPRSPISKPSPLAPTALVARLSSAPGTPLPSTPLAQEGQNSEKLFRHVRSTSSASNTVEDEEESFVT